MVFLPFDNQYYSLHLLIYTTDLNEYLPEATKTWCTLELEKLGYGHTRVNASEYFPDGTRVHCQVYLQLRRALQVHIASGAEPCLSECEKPTGAWHWNPESTNGDRIESVDIYGEGVDPGANQEDFTEDLENEN
jgi:hypothetical protein